MIRLACADDLDAVDAIYDAILTLEEARPVSITNWQRGKYPTLDHARRAMEEHTLWLAGEDGKYYGTFILNGIQLPEYMGHEGRRNSCTYLSHSKSGKRNYSPLQRNR